MVIRAVRARYHLNQLRLARFPHLKMATGDHSILSRMANQLEGMERGSEPPTDASETERLCRKLPDQNRNLVHPLEQRGQFVHDTLQFLTDLRENHSLGI